MTKDTLFKKARSSIKPFEFDAAVAQVFDDMIRRSVPHYEETIMRQAELIERHYQTDTLVYDLGCSTGNLGIAICHRMTPVPIPIQAIDSSAPMLAVYAKRLADLPNGECVRLCKQDIRRTQIHNASVVVLNYTLQFVPVSERDALITKIHAGLKSGGILLLSEKTTHPDPAMARMQIEFYYDFKRKNGYSELEISQKREALERVLVPETIEHHLARLQRNGFGSVEVWHKWFNFASMVAIK